MYLILNNTWSMPVQSGIHPQLVGLHKVFDCSLVSSRVVPQSPANGFANEELLFMGPFQTELEQPVSIRLLLLAKLE